MLWKHLIVTQAFTAEISENLSKNNPSKVWNIPCLVNRGGPRFRHFLFPPLEQLSNECWCFPAGWLAQMRNPEIPHLFWLCAPHPSPRHMEELKKKTDGGSKSKATNSNWPKVPVKVFWLREITNSSQRLSRSLSLHPKDNKAVKPKAVCYRSSWAEDLQGRHKCVCPLTLQHGSKGQDRAFVILLVVGVRWHSLKNSLPISAVTGRALQSWVGRYAAAGSRRTGRASLPHSQAEQGRAGPFHASDD